MVVDLAAAVRTAGRATHVFLDRALQMSAWFFAAPPVSLLASTLVTTTLAVSYVCTGLAIGLVWASVNRLVLVGLAPRPVSAGFGRRLEHRRVGRAAHVVGVVGIRAGERTAQMSFVEVERGLASSASSGPR